MRILLDMNLSPTWLETLSSAGHEVVHWSAVGLANASDVEIMQFAKQGDFIVLTEDLDFGILLARNRLSGPSVVQIRTGMNLPRQIAGRVLDALEQTQSMLLAGALVSIDAQRNRVTPLPIG